MQQSSIDTLEKHKHHYDCYISSGYVKNFDMQTRQDILDVIHREFDPGYTTTMWCSECMFNMLKYAYGQYQKYLDGINKAVT